MFDVPNVSIPYVEVGIDNHLSFRIAGTRQPACDRNADDAAGTGATAWNATALYADEDPVIRRSAGRCIVDLGRRRTLPVGARKHRACIRRGAHRSPCNRNLVQRRIPAIIPAHIQVPGPAPVVVRVVKVSRIKRRNASAGGPEFRKGRRPRVARKLRWQLHHAVIVISLGEQIDLPIASVHNRRLGNVIAIIPASRAI